MERTSGAVDSAATSNAYRPEDPHIKTGRKSKKIFQMPTGETTPATDEGLLIHNVREPARTLDIVPDLTTQSLISVGKFADANYFTIFDGEEVNIYDANNTKVTVSRNAILRGYRDHESGLWRIPLVKKVTNNNTDTILVSKQPSEFLPN